MSIITNLISWLITLVLTGALVFLWRKYKNTIRNIRDRGIYEEAIGLVKIYTNREEAVNDQINALTRTSDICFLAYNGFALLDKPSYLDSSMNSIISGFAGMGEKNIRILLLSPKNITAIRNRIERIGIKDIDGSIQDHVQDIIRNSQILERMGKSRPNVEVTIRYFNSELLWCLIIFDSFILVSFYQEGATAKNARTLLIKQNSLLGASFEYYFDYFWRSNHIKSDSIPELGNIDEENVGT
uniref:Uncharacterized protein n=1 Tax=Candidatus Kentrum sp. LPFa TaxID=2126335 RepID=A0A450X5Y5_9GAMM|nr:MAG: hypothetical protein BECKLPF1236A_GA0070988_104323 [Candidatus Kentron sp. LPFa]VFK35982.1 MAG: hypothetical protein BECKLPF1236C_GA0070990_104613 [Candidatus Kentron sp. LPFa]